MHCMIVANFKISSCKGMLAYKNPIIFFWQKFFDIMIHPFEGKTNDALADEPGRNLIMCFKTFNVL